MCRRPREKRSREDDGGGVGVVVPPPLPERGNCSIPDVETGRGGHPARATVHFDAGVRDPRRPPAKLPPPAPPPSDRGEGGSSLDAPHSPDKRAHLLKTAFWIAAWYGTSTVTLFLNKIILDMPGGDVHLLGATQMTMTAVLGGVKVLAPSPSAIASAAAGWLGRSKGAGGRRCDALSTEEPSAAAAAGATSGGPRNTDLAFLRDMVLVGLLRGSTVILGLVSLSHVAVSFTETVKASAPLFTVIFARLILGERTSGPVMLSLVPVMVGLGLCSAYELSFDAVGFGAAVLNNCIDCVQNVFSKRLLRGTLTPAQLQFFTSASAIALQLPLAARTTLPRIWSNAQSGGMDQKLWQCLLIDAVSYHLQSVSAYYAMSCMSPVSMSVANTLKRALLIWISILYFGNTVTGHTVAGMIAVVAGVFLYNHLRRVCPAKG